VLHVPACYTLTLIALVINAKSLRLLITPLCNILSFCFFCFFVFFFFFFCLLLLLLLLLLLFLCDPKNQGRSFPGIMDFIFRNVVGFLGWNMGLSQVCPQKQDKRHTSAIHCFYRVLILPADRCINNFILHCVAGDHYSLHDGCSYSFGYFYLSVARRRSEKMGHSELNCNKCSWSFSILIFFMDIISVC
jgi:hypothetical protein